MPLLRACSANDARWLGCRFSGEQAVHDDVAAGGGFPSYVDFPLETVGVTKRAVLPSASRVWCCWLL